MGIQVPFFRPDIREQEINSRVTAAGLKIYYDPALSTSYIQKTMPKAFFKRAYRFGNYHPVTWKVNPRAFPSSYVMLCVLGWLFIYCFW